MRMSLPCLSGMRTAAMVRQGTERLPRCEVYLVRLRVRMRVTVRVRVGVKVG